MIGEKFGRLTVSGLSHRAKETMTTIEFAEWAKRLGAMADQWG